MPRIHKRQSEAGVWKLTRRDFLKGPGLVAAGLFVGWPIANAGDTEGGTGLRFGIVTDAHYADTDPRGSRYYRKSAPKMTECVARMNEAKVDFLIELGDFKDEGQPASEKGTLTYLESIEKVFREFRGPRYHVLGNHDMDSISKEQFLSAIDNTGIGKEFNYYSFDSHGLHFVVLDANYKGDGSNYDHGNFDWTDANIPREELDWLRRDLETTSKPVIVFVHQQLDGEGSHYVNNAAEARRVLQERHKVLAVFQGHNHAGHYSRIDGIHYYTLKAMVEGREDEDNSYAVVEVDDSHNIVVNGYRRALSRTMEMT